MEFKNIITEVKDGVGVLTINRPDILNTLNTETLNEIIQGIRGLGDNDNVNVIIIIGAGDRAFITGVDVEELNKMSKGDSERFVHIGHDTMRTVEELEKPVIAMVNGFALGVGAELILACDFAYAVETAKFGFPEVAMGIFPGFGGTQRLARCIGVHKAKELIYTGRTISAICACEWGLINKVVHPEKLLDETFTLAHEIIKRGQVAVRYAKKAINKGLYLSLSEGLESERDLFVECFSTEDRREGMAALLDKRKPEFKGK